VSDKKIKAPFVPEITGKMDVKNFDEEFTNEPIEQSLIAQKSLDMIKRNNDKFKDF